MAGSPPPSLPADDASPPPDALQALLALVADCLAGTTPLDQCAAALAAHPDAPDVLWLAGLMHERGSEKWNSLCQLVGQVAEASPAVALSLVLVLEHDLLGGAGIIDETIAKNKTVKVNTTLKYRQIKYNLLSESNEGCAKALCELHKDEPSADALLSLVGTFRLDPNRLVDLILDCLSLRVEADRSDAHVALLTSLGVRKENLTQMLGFKFQNNLEEYYDVAAALIGKGLIDLEGITPHLQPRLSDFASMAKAYDDYLREWTPRVGKTNLGTGKKFEKPEEPKLVDQISPFLGALLRNPDSEQSGRHLIEVLRQHGALNHQIQRLGEVRHGMRVVLERILAKSTALDEGGALYSWLTLTGSALCEDPALLTRVMRVLADVGPSPRVLDLLELSLLPSIAMIESSNPAIVIELWQKLLSKFDYPVRFELYRKQLVFPPPPQAALRRAEIAHETTVALKKVAKEKLALRMSGIKLSRQVNVDPTCALPVLLKNIQSYENMIPTVIDMFKYVAPWGLDVLAFMLVYFLADDARSKIKDDGTNVSLWLSTLCKFAGQFYLKNPSAELRGLLYLVGRKLRLGESTFLLALENVVAKMSGFVVLEDISDAVLQCAAGGEVLKAQSRLPSGDSVLTVSAMSLRKLGEAIKSLYLPLVLLVCRQRTLVMNSLPDETTDDATVISACLTFDTCSANLVQLCEYGAANKMQVVLPLLENMVGEMGIEPVVAFYVTRKLGKVTPADTATVLKYQAPSSSANFQLTALYATFWELGLSDLLVPEDQYTLEIQRVKARADALQKQPVGEVGAEVFKSAQAAKKRQEEIKALRQTCELLQSEVVAQKSWVAQVDERLTGEKSLWFPTTDLELDFVQACIVPRILFSQEDALYAFNFFKRVLGSPNFAAMKFLDVVLRCLLKAVFAATEREAANMAIFFKRVFTQLWAWRDVKADFVHAVPGVDHEVYVKTCREWHDDVAQTLTSAFRGRNLNQRQAVILLNNMAACYPDTVEVMERLMAPLELIQKDETKPDSLRTMSRGLAHVLLSRKSAGKLRMAATGLLYTPAPPERRAAPAAAASATTTTTTTATAAASATEQNHSLPSAAAQATNATAARRGGSISRAKDAAAAPVITGLLARQPRAPSKPHYDDSDGEVAENGAEKPSRPEAKRPRMEDDSRRVGSQESSGRGGDRRAEGNNSASQERGRGDDARRGKSPSDQRRGNSPETRRHRSSPSPTRRRDSRTMERDRGDDRGGVRGDDRGGVRGDDRGGVRGDDRGGVRGDDRGGVRGDDRGGRDAGGRGGDDRGGRDGGARGDDRGGARGDDRGGARGDDRGGARGDDKGGRDAGGRGGDDRGGRDGGARGEGRGGEGGRRDRRESEADRGGQRGEAQSQQQQQRGKVAAASRKEEAPTSKDSAPLLSSGASKDASAGGKGPAGSVKGSIGKPPTPAEASSAAGANPPVPSKAAAVVTMAPQTNPTTKQLNLNSRLAPQRSVASVVITKPAGDGAASDKPASEASGTQKSAVTITASAVKPLLGGSSNEAKSEETKPAPSSKRQAPGGGDDMPVALVRKKKAE